jgi:hypothetical protein
MRAMTVPSSLAGFLSPLGSVLVSRGARLETDVCSCGESCSHLSHTTRDRSLRNYKNNHKVNYDLLEVDGKP